MSLPETSDQISGFNKDTNLKEGEILIKEASFVWENPRIKKLASTFCNMSEKKGQNIENIREGLEMSTYTEYAI